VNNEILGLHKKENIMIKNMGKRSFTPLFPNLFFTKTKNSSFIDPSEVIYSNKLKKQMKGILWEKSYLRKS
jgi:hypothetical protein